MENKNKLDVKGVMSEGYGIIPKKVMKDKDLTIDAKAIYAFISSYAGAGSTSFPSVNLITDMLGISRQRFNKHRKLLEDKGYITIKKNRTPEGSWGNNVYTLETLPGLQNLTSGNLTSGNPTSGNLTTNNNTFNNNTINNNNDNIDRQSSIDDLSISQRFEKIWKDCPNKQGKKPAFSSYKTALKNGTTDKDIIEGLERYKKHLEQNPWKNVAQGSTWFKQNRWEDEFEETKSNDGISDLPTGSYDPLADVRDLEI